MNDALTNVVEMDEAISEVEPIVFTRETPLPLVPIGWVIVIAGIVAMLWVMMSPGIKGLILVGLGMGVIGMMMLVRWHARHDRVALHADYFEIVQHGQTQQIRYEDVRSVRQQKHGFDMFTEVALTAFRRVRVSGDLADPPTLIDALEQMLTAGMEDRTRRTGQDWQRTARRIGLGLFGGLGALGGAVLSIDHEFGFMVSWFAVTAATVGVAGAAWCASNTGFDVKQSPRR